MTRRQQRPPLRCIDTEASLAGPASIYPEVRSPSLIVGIDVHKHTHAAALIDAQGRKLDALTLSNSPAGYRGLSDWLVDHDAADAVVGVESPGSYGRCLVAALIAAGLEVLQVPAWARTASVTSWPRQDRSRRRAIDRARRPDRPRRARTR